MELTQEERKDFIICPNCKHLVPRTPLCIYCGVRLRPSTRPQQEARKERVGGVLVEGVKPTEAEGSEVEEKYGNLINCILWRAKLVWLLNEGKVSKDIFKRIYNDYTSRINSMIKGKGDLAALLEGGSVRSRLEEARRRLDELMVRHRVGEIPDDEYLARYAALKSSIDELEREALRMELQYRHIRRVIGELFGGDLSRVKEQIREYYNKLPTLFGKGELVDVEAVDGVKNDLELMLRILESAEVPTYTRSENVSLMGEEVGYGYGEELFDEELLFERIREVIKGHDDEIRRVIRAIKLRDNVLIIGRHAEGKTELLLQLHKYLGGIYLHCHEEVSERELVAGFNPSAFVGENPIHKGCLMQIVSGDVKGLPIAFIDEIMKLRPKTQIILFEAMNNKTFFNPVDGKTYYLPPEFSVVSSSNMESIVQETPDIAFLDRFGKIVVWRDTPDEAIIELLEPYRLPPKVLNFLLWVRHQVKGMRYLIPLSVRNLCKFAHEYNRYRDIYSDPDELKKLAVDRLVKVKVFNTFGFKEFEEAKERIEEYIEENF